MFAAVVQHKHLRVVVLLLTDKGQGQQRVKFGHILNINQMYFYEYKIG